MQVCECVLLIVCILNFRLFVGSGIYLFKSDLACYEFVAGVCFKLSKASSFYILYLFYPLFILLKAFW